tara:strand:+ start:1092 stop:1790 length:699 start_codon:yes stop_codon:yes gene_type:complete
LNFEVQSKETYFDLSEKEIQIETNFIGKEIIIFGILEENHDIILTIKGPRENNKLLMKERILGLWLNTKKVIYKDIPSLFFLASTKPIKDILSSNTILKKKLQFDSLLVNAVTSRNFLQQKNLNNWNENLIKIKIKNNLFKEYELNNVENKLFQTRVFFPSNSIPGIYNVTIYQIKNKIIQGEKKQIIYVKKAGIGEKIYTFAHEQPAIYGLIAIFFAIISGLLAATIFRRL